MFTDFANSLNWTRSSFVVFGGRMRRAPSAYRVRLFRIFLIWRSNGVWQSRLAEKERFISIAWCTRNICIFDGASVCVWRSWRHCASSSRSWAETQNALTSFVRYHTRYEYAMWLQCTIARERENYREWAIAIAWSLHPSVCHSLLSSPRFYNISVFCSVLGSYFVLVSGFWRVLANVKITARMAYTRDSSAGMEYNNVNLIICPQGDMASRNICNCYLHETFAKHTYTRFNI